MDYYPRVTDVLLQRKLEAFGATLIVGPKGCGKTTTGKRFAKSYIEFQDEDQRENYLAVAENMPSRLLIGDKPRLFDEWQDAPKIWGAIRKDVDDSGAKGQYILTGSSSRQVATPHTGTLRISTMQMYPMSLFESQESTGTVSLRALFQEQSLPWIEADLSFDELLFAICRGGWPQCLTIERQAVQLDVVRDLFYQTCHVDISQIHGVQRNPKWAEKILKSYARNLCTLATSKTLYGDIQATTDLSRQSFIDYIQDLEDLFIIEELEAWCPAIRSKGAIRASNKRNLIDPSLAVAALGLEPDYFNTDFKTLGFLFESLCIRDLKIYSAALGGKMSYYRDRYGLEADGVLHLANGQYALIEFKLGQAELDEGARHLCEIERLIQVNNEDKTKTPIRLPDLKLLITGTPYGYQRKDGVFVVPIACLRD